MTKSKHGKKSSAAPAARGKEQVVCVNRRASHLLAIDEELEAGLVLAGTEVKALRAGHAHLSEAYVQVVGGQAVLVGGHIGEYSHGNQFNHEPGRSRRLLLHRRQVDKLMVQLGREGYTALPLRLYFNERGLAKLAFGVGRGKGHADKRQDIKAREAERDVARALRRGQR